jgi:hypothetical protein
MNGDVQSKWIFHVAVAAMLLFDCENPCNFFTKFVFTKRAKGRKLYG